ncbi:hypothetical protein BDV95DRAFT_496104 [Massariosphaeria phaeospora]|uniref:Uncharacterized protein n=1 Tax=Massariosphaeria phaeospora TaxID=100035 RepID=A0A7C8IDS1_9PLEO|nr:hypothetical protein BDV95DRAFT_496104 [Massariosphaeria phaeospora]
MAHSWLQRKRKGELMELAQRANLPDVDGLLKDDLVDLLYNHLGSNAHYAKQSVFSDFYGRTASPYKRERVSTAETALMVPRPSRRQTVIKRADSESETPELTPEKPFMMRTPRAVDRIASRVAHVDYPASPAQLAEVADQSFQVAKTKATELWNRTKIDEAIEYVRDNASSVAAIQTLILVIEASGLQWNTLGTTFLGSTPPVLGATNDVYIPELWLLLTSDWWAPATLWSLTSWVLPLLVSYFFNLTLRSNTQRESPSRQSTIDPFTFNIVRAILAYSAYRIPVIGAGLVGEPGIARAQTLNWGPFSEATVRTVRENVPGEYYGLQIGSVVGLLVSLYTAALQK